MSRKSVSRILRTSPPNGRREQGAHIIAGLHQRDEILARALAPLGAAGQMDDDLAHDFLALGYCYLQIELLTRRMRYSSNLDQDHFQKQLVTAARAMAEDDRQQAREHLSKCFDLLGEERDHYYPVDAHILDLSLVASTTMGVSLRSELARDMPVNLVLPASTLAQMAQQQPESLARLVEALRENRCSVVGGPARELPDPLLPCETILGQLTAGMDLYQQLLDHPLTIYGRHRYGLTTFVPQILHKLGFSGLLHASFDGGRFPDSTQSKTRWEGMDGSSIDAVARVPLNALRAESYLNLAIKIGESMESDYVATVVLAHWAGQSSPWHEDLQRCARYTSALGKPVTLTRFFQQTEHAGHLDRFKPDQYASPYLHQAVQREEADPISRFVHYWRAWGLLAARRTLATWLRLAGGPAMGDGVGQDEIDRLLDSAADAATDAAKPDPWHDVENQLDREFSTAATELARFLARGPGSEAPRYVLINPHSFPQRTGIELDDLTGPPDVEKPVYAAGQSQGKQQVVVDVPAAGFAWVAPGQGSVDKKQSSELVEENVLRNEFLQARIDPHTGALGSLYDYHSRGNRISQQLALRSTSLASTGQAARTAEDLPYSTMVADSVEVTSSSTILGEITATGRLVDATGRKLAGFVQCFRVWRGSRVLMLDIQLDPLEALGPDPWKSYYACRFAWSDESAELFRSVNMTRQATEAKRLEAPLMVEIDDGTTRTAVLTGGLPYHRRVGSRKLDSLLIVRGERARRFHLGIGVDLKQPLTESLGQLVPPRLVRVSAAPPPARGLAVSHQQSGGRGHLVGAAAGRSA